MTDRFDDAFEPARTADEARYLRSLGAHDRVDSVLTA